jgi:hypothetical protein
MCSVATHADLTEEKIIWQLENSHSYYCFFMAFEACMGFNTLQHIGFAFMTGMAVQTGYLPLFPLESNAHKQAVSVMRVYCLSPEQLLIIVTLATNQVLLSLCQFG